MLAIGAWPLIMGVTMFLQQKLNPTPPDPVQAKMFMALPVVFTFMLAKFPAGLVSTRFQAIADHTDHSGLAGRTARRLLAQGLSLVLR